MMEIIDKSKPKASKFVYDKWIAKHGISENASFKERQLWVEKEKEYWVEGRFGLVGTHYFALTQGFGKNAYGAESRLIWRDVDEEIYGGYDKAKNDNWDLLILKRRELGLTLVFGGIIPLHTALTMPGSTSLLTSADKTRLQQMYYEKLMVAYKNLSPLEYDTQEDLWVKPGVVSHRQTGYLHLGTDDRKTGIVTGLDSKVIAEETVKNPTSFEAFRAQYIFIDEMFLHGKADQVLRSAQASVKSGFRKIAPIVMGGSAGEASLVGQKIGVQMWKNAETIHLVTLFVPGTRGIMEAPVYDEQGKEVPGKYENFCINGHSDEKKATEWIMRTRDRLDTLEDKAYLNTFIKQYPLTVEEVFTGNAQGNLRKDILDKILQQERIILATRVPIERVTLTEVEDGDGDKEIKIIPDAKGRVRILQRPVVGHVYGSGTDPIPFNTNSVGDDKSKQCIVIKDYTTNTYVAYLMDRNSDPDMIVKESILLQDLYYKPKTMLEINRGGVTKSKYKEYGRLDLLAPKPTILNKKYSDAGESYGYYKNDWTATEGNFYLMEYLSKCADNIWFPEIIDEAKNWLAENTDILDAMTSCEIGQRAVMKKQEKTLGYKKVENKQVRMLVRGPDGRMITQWRTVQLPVR